MSKAADYKQFIQSIRSGIGYWKTYSLMQFTSALARIMKLEDVHGKNLAARLGISPTQVSKVLSGQENITVETMAKFADALDAVVHIHVAKRGVQVEWREIPVEQEEMEQAKPGFNPSDSRTVVKFTASAVPRKLYSRQTTARSRTSPRPPNRDR
ncbi:MAG TPA: helix-turn-helix transcriptional regulator [Thermoanaerobaculia bacterium]